MCGLLDGMLYRFAIYCLWAAWYQQFMVGLSVFFGLPQVVSFVAMPGLCSSLRVTWHCNMATAKQASSPSTPPPPHNAFDPMDTFFSVRLPRAVDVSTYTPAS